MKIAILDLGTNTFHLMIANVRKNRSFKTLLKTRAVVKLGRGGLRENRIADVPMQRWHRSRLDAALEAVAHDQVVTGPEPVDEGSDGRPVVAVVGVTHDDEAAAGGFDAALERAAVAGKFLPSPGYVQAIGKRSPGQHHATAL